MEADFMVRQAPFHNNLFILSFFILFSCHDRETALHPIHVDVSIENDSRFKTKNGIVLFNQLPFTGCVYTLYTNSNDTLSWSAYVNGKEHGEWKQFYKNHQWK